MQPGCSKDNICYISLFEGKRTNRTKRIMDIINHWEGIFATRAWGKYPDTNVVRFIARNFFKFDDRSKINILELGPGPGANLWFLAREGFTTWGIEGSQTAHAKSVQMLRDNNLESRIGKLHCGNFTDIPFENQFFDGILDIEALSCNDYETSKSVIKSSLQKLKTGGRLYSLAFSNHTDIEGEQVGHNYYKISGGNFHGMGKIRLTSEENIKDLYNLNNSKIINIDRFVRYLSDGTQISEWGIEVEKI